MIVKDKKYTLSNLVDKDNLEMGQKNFLMQQFQSGANPTGATTPAPTGQPAQTQQTVGGPSAGLLNGTAVISHNNATANPNINVQNYIGVLNNTSATLASGTQTTQQQPNTNNLTPGTSNQQNNSGNVSTGGGFGGLMSKITKYLPGNALKDRWSSIWSGAGGLEYAKLDTEIQKSYIQAVGSIEQGIVQSTIQGTAGILEADIKGQYDLAAKRIEQETQLGSAKIQAAATNYTAVMQYKQGVYTADSQKFSEVYKTLVQSQMSVVDGMILGIKSMQKKVEDEKAGGKLAAVMTTQLILPAIQEYEELESKKEYLKYIKEYNKEILKYKDKHALWVKKNPGYKKWKKDDVRLDSEPQLPEFNFQYDSGGLFRTISSPDKSIASIKIPDVNKIRVNELGFERQNHEQGNLSEFKLFYVPAHDGNTKTHVTSSAEASHMQEVITVRSGEHGKDKKYYFKGADGKIGRELSASEQTKLMAKVYFVGTDLKQAVFVDKEEAEEVYFKKSLSRDEEFFTTILSKKNEHYARQMSELLTEWQNGTSLFVVIFKAIALHMRAKKEGLTGKDGVKEDLGLLQKAMEHTGALTDADRAIFNQFAVELPAEEAKQKILADAMQAMVVDGQVNFSEKVEFLKKLERAGFNQQEMDSYKYQISALENSADGTRIITNQYRLLLNKSKDSNLSTTIQKAIEDSDLNATEKQGIVNLINANPHLSQGEKDFLTNTINTQKSLSGSAKLLRDSFQDDEIISVAEKKKIETALKNDKTNIDSAIKELVNPILNLSPESLGTEEDLKGFADAVKEKYEETKTSKAGGGTGPKNKKGK